MRPRPSLGLALEIGVPAAVLPTWWLLSMNSTSFYFPPLSRIFEAFADTWLFERVGSDVLPSLYRLVLGYGLGVAIGVGLGVGLGRSVLARRAAEPVVEFLRAIPPPVLIPLAILMLGVDTSMKIFLIAFGSVWPVLLNTIDGVRSLDPSLAQMAQAYGLDRQDRLLRVIVPSAAPQIFAGMRSALSIAIILMVISEMIASTNGVGYFVLQSQRTFRIPDMWAGILLLGLLGYSLNLAFLLAERRVLRWHRGSRQLLAEPDPGMATEKQPQLSPAPGSSRSRRLSNAGRI